MNSKVYKSCGVPQCRNTSIKTPNKLFVYVPNKKTVRDSWLRMASRDPTHVSTSTPIYFCEDHFDLPNDMENYMQYHVMGTVAQVRMHPGCVPTKFACQPGRKISDNNKPYITKRKKIDNEVEFENGKEHLNGIPSGIKMEYPEPKMIDNLSASKGTTSNTNIKVKEEFDSSETEQEVTVKIESIESDDFSSNICIKDEFVKEEPEVHAVFPSNGECMSTKSELLQIKNDSMGVTFKEITCQEDTCQKVPCNQCELTTKDESAIQTPMTCDFWKLRAKEDEENHNILSQKWYACNQCNKYFTCKSTLISHMRTHTGEKPYICLICKIGFSHKSTLVTHERTHTGEKPYTCNICNKTFRQRSNLNVHIRIHTGEKPYACSMCDKKFSQKCVLTIHLRMHTGEKIYACDICDTRYASKFSLSRHKLTHTKNGRKRRNLKLFESSEDIPPNI